MAEDSEKVAYMPIVDKLVKYSKQVIKTPHIKKYVDKYGISFMLVNDQGVDLGKYQIYYEDTLIGEILDFSEYYLVKTYQKELTCTTLKESISNVFTYLTVEQLKERSQGMYKVLSSADNTRTQIESVKNQKHTTKYYFQVLDNLFSKYAQNPSIREVAEKGVVLVINEEGISLDLIKMHKSSLNYERYRIVTLYGFNLDEAISHPIDSSRIVKSELTTQDQENLYNAFVGYILD